MARQAAVTDRKESRREPSAALPVRESRATPRGEHWRGWEALVAAGLMLAALAIRLYRLGALGLWEDEGWTAEVARMPLAEIVAWCAGDYGPPLYYLLVHFWAALWPGDVGLRLPSVLCGALAVPLIYLCGCAAHSSSAGLVAALLLTTNTFHVRYSQEARFYALLFLASLVALLFTLELARRPSPGRWLGWMLAVTAMLYTHCAAAVYVLALSGLLWALRPGLRDPIWRGWLAAHAAAAVLFLPWAVILVQQTARVIGDYWPATPGLGTLAATLLQMLAIPLVAGEGGPVDMPLAAALLAAPYAGVVAWHRATGRGADTHAALKGLLLYALGAWALIFLFSVTVRSIYILRVLIPTLGGLLLAVAVMLAAAEHGRHRAPATALLGLLALGGCLSLGLHFREFRKQEIRAAAHYALDHAADTDAVGILQDRLRPTMEHYLGDRLPLIRTGLCRFAVPGRETGGLTPEQAAAEFSKLSSLWVVGIEDTEGKEFQRETDRWLGTFMRKVEERGYYQVRLTRYVPQ